ncbi:hypothetical protein [Lacticaseibacillus parakribbianus]|uniref:hypothetical protein n=1 Tax=Lacticaseibacillus parakribbianus TaxID=2970927 RepID=UPI0021CB0DCF|nr:hypothetical protein [Lacticaseibacillus parakribbianus]
MAQVELMTLNARLAAYTPRLVVTEPAVVALVFALSNRWRGDVVYEDHGGGLATAQLTATAFHQALAAQLAVAVPGELTLEVNQVKNAAYFTQDGEGLRELFRLAPVYRLTLERPQALELTWRGLAARPGGWL